MTTLGFPRYASPLSRAHWPNTTVTSPVFGNRNNWLLDGVFATSLPQVDAVGGPSHRQRRSKRTGRFARSATVMKHQLAKRRMDF